jgi:hypothetical protein
VLEGGSLAIGSGPFRTRVETAAIDSQCGRSQLRISLDRLGTVARFPDKNRVAVAARMAAIGLKQHRRLCHISGRRFKTAESSYAPMQMDRLENPNQ